MHQETHNISMDTFRGKLHARAAALLTLFVFTFVFYLNPTGMAIAEELAREDKYLARLEAVLESTPERKFSHRLNKLREKLEYGLPRAIEERSNQRGFLARIKQRVLPDTPLTAAEVRELRLLSQSIAEAYEEARDAFEQEVQLVQTESLSSEARQLLQKRHAAALLQIRERYQVTQVQLDDLVAADSASKQQQALDALSDSLREETFKQRHTPATPDQLPWGVPDAEVREPVDNPQDLHAYLGINPYAHYAQLAQSGDDYDLIARAQANAANQQLQTSLAESIEVVLAPEIRALAAELNHNAPNIYSWVHNNIRYIPSHGSIQGAQLTLETKRGNAIDTASLLIALLRASDIPARYAYGTVQLPAEQVMNWVGGVETAEAAQSLLGQGGVPSIGMVQGGRVSHIQMEHVWVEAWVDYSPSLGVKDRGGDTWIPMDASFKQYDFIGGMNLQEAVPFDAEGLVTQIQQSATVNETEGWVQNVPQSTIEQQLNDFQQQLENYITQQNPEATVGEVLGIQEIKILPPRPLAAGLPYQRIVTSSTFAEVPDNLRHKFHYTLSTQVQGYKGEQILRIEEPTVKLAGKTLALSFKPATEEDAAIIAALLPQPDENGEINPNLLPNTLPGYLIGLTAEFTINNQVVATGPANTMGTELHETLSLWSPKEGWRNSTNYPTAGQYRAIGLDLQGSSPEQAAQLQQRLEQTKIALESRNASQLESLTKHDLVGDLLYATIFSYFALNSLQDEIAARNASIVQYRLPSYGFFSTSLQTQYWFGIPRNVNFSGFSMDIDRMTSQQVSKNNNVSESIAFQQVIGARMSALEHFVPEQMFSTENGQAQGVSAVKAIAIAATEGQKIWTINRNNLDTALNSINLGADTERDIRNAVRAGKTVTTHEAQLIFSGSIVEGYIIHDPNTGAGAYIIAGGGNGSFVDISKDVLSGVAEWYTYLGLVVSVGAGAAALLGITVAGPIFLLAIGAAFAVVSMLDLFINCNMNNVGIPMFMLAVYEMAALLFGLVAIMFAGVAGLLMLVAIAKIVSFIGDLGGASMSIVSAPYCRS